MRSPKRRVSLPRPRNIVSEVQVTKKNVLFGTERQRNAEVRWKNKTQQLARTEGEVFSIPHCSLCILKGCLCKDVIRGNEVHNFMYRNELVKGSLHRQCLL